jgi:hypothetical protein
VERGFIKPYASNISNYSIKPKSFYILKYSKLEYYISKPRLDRFLSVCNNSKTKAEKLYRINLRVSQSFYPVLNLFEVFIRNAMNYRISGYFSDPNWIINQKSGFMSDTSLKKSGYFLKGRVKKAERVIRRREGTVTPGRVIAEQSFSFWTSLFDKYHYKLIGGVVIKSFDNKPARVNRNVLSKKLNEIREFRNRIYHNEPICFNDSTIDFEKAIQVKDDIYELLEWVDQDLKQYVEYFDTITSKINTANNI